MKFVFAALLAASLVYAADDASVPAFIGIGTWKVNGAKSKIPDTPPPPRDATLTITDKGWTYTEIDAAGKKTDITEKGDDKVTIKWVPTGNPYVSDVRFILKENGQELQRSITVVQPDGKNLYTFSSGIGPDGKPWTNALCWEKVP